jgi:hypothetical protein
LKEFLQSFTSMIIANCLSATPSCDNMFFMYHSHPSKGKPNLWPWRCPSSAALLSTVVGVHQVAYYLWEKFPFFNLIVFVLLIIIKNTCRCEMSFIVSMDFIESSFDYSQWAFLPLTGMFTCLI